MSFVLANVDHIYTQDPSLTKTDVDTLFQWSKTQPYLPQLTELQLVLFLHSCHYDTEAAKTTIAYYFTMKSGSDLLKSADEDTIRKGLSKVLTVVLPKRTPEGYSILYTKLLDPRAEVFDCENMVKLLLMVMNLYFHRNGPTNGFLVLVDMDTASFGHLFKLNISAIKLVASFLQEAAPMRLIGQHFINVGRVTSHLIALGKPFLKKETYEAIRVHSNYSESLYEYIPKNCLIKELGGSLPSYLELNEENIDNVVKHVDFFKWLDAQNIDESLRQDRGRGFFGTVQGFFKNA